MENLYSEEVTFINLLYENLEALKHRQYSEEVVIRKARSMI
jgi:stress response protein YsnF